LLSIGKCESRDQALFLKLQLSKDQINFLRKWYLRLYC
jgi:hypothetical protein